MYTVLTIGTSIAILVVITGAVPPQVCFANFRWEDCGKPPVPVVYYWKTGSRCEVGIWRGCLPNLNMFKNEYECVSTCIFTVRAEPEDYHKLNEIEEFRDIYTEETTSERGMKDTDIPDTDIMDIIDNTDSYLDNNIDTNPSQATNDSQVATDSTDDNGIAVTNTGNDDRNNDSSTNASGNGNNNNDDLTNAGGNGDSNNDVSTYASGNGDSNNDVSTYASSNGVSNNDGSTDAGDNSEAGGTMNAGEENASTVGY